MLLKLHSEYDLALIEKIYKDLWRKLENVSSSEFQLLERLSEIYPDWMISYRLIRL